MDRSAKGLTEEIVSPATQEDRARAYCESQGWAVAAVERDIDESAYRQHYSKRAGLMRLLEAVERGELSRIVVFKFNRVSRRLKEFVEICDRVEKAGGGVVSITEQADTSTPHGKLIRNILASFAQFVSEELSEQISETWVTRAKQGLRPPGAVPFGALSNRGVLEPDPATHAHLLALYRTYAETGSLRACWDYLDGAKVPPPRAEGWHLISIRKILRNPIYTGALNWDGTAYEGRWEPLVPVDLWEAVQVGLAGRRDTRERRRDARLLSGLVVCGGCGRPMWIRHDQRKKERELLVLYSCYERHSMRRGCASTPTVAAEELEREVWATVDLARRVDRRALVVRLDGGQADPDLLHRQVETLNSRIATLFDLVGTGDISREEFRAQHRRYREELAALQAQIGARAPADSPGHAVLEAMDKAATAATLEERRGVLEALGATVTISEHGASLELIGDVWRLKPRRIQGTMHFGAQYQLLDYPGPLMTDWQHEFLRRTWDRFDRQAIADRMGRSRNAIHRAVYRLQRKESASTASR